MIPDEAVTPRRGTTAIGSQGEPRIANGIVLDALNLRSTEHVAQCVMGQRTTGTCVIVILAVAATIGPLAAETCTCYRPLRMRLSARQNALFLTIQFIPSVSSESDIFFYRRPVFFSFLSRVALCSQGEDSSWMAVDWVTTATQRPHNFFSLFSL